jgi:hypothetical protein
VNKEEWFDKFEARLIERGVDKEFAKATRDASSEDVDLSYDPADAADDEISYWYGN